MRVLLDESLPHRLAVLLNAAGHDAIHLRSLDLLGATDDVVLQAAADESRVLISSDTDFGDLLSRRSLRGPSVVLLRRTPRTTEAIALLLEVALSAVQEALREGAIAVVTPERIRYRLLPVRRGVQEGP